MRHILRRIKRRKADWIDHILRRSCLLNHVIEGKLDRVIEVWEDKEEDVTRYWMIFRKRDVTGT
jgi:hypothetical protein